MIANKVRLMPPIFFLSMQLVAGISTSFAAVDEVQPPRGALTAEQLKAIKQISIGVVGGHNSQRDDSQASEQLLAISTDLDEQIADESSTAVQSQPAETRRAERRAERNNKLKQWATRLRDRVGVLRQGGGAQGRAHALMQAEKLQGWSDELQALSSDTPVPDRLKRLRQLRESMRLSRFQRADDAFAPPTPTMTMRLPK